MLKVLFAGTPDVAVPSLKLLAQDTEHFEVVAVLTRPDAPTGRGNRNKHDCLRFLPQAPAFH